MKLMANKQTIAFLLFEYTGKSFSFYFLSHSLSPLLFWLFSWICFLFSCAKSFAANMKWMENFVYIHISWSEIFLLAMTKATTSDTVCLIVWQKWQQQPILKCSLDDSEKY